MNQTRATGYRHAGNVLLALSIFLTGCSSSPMVRQLHRYGLTQDRTARVVYRSTRPSEPHIQIESTDPIVIRRIWASLADTYRLKGFTPRLPSAHCLVLFPTDHPDQPAATVFMYGSHGENLACSVSSGPNDTSAASQRFFCRQLQPCIQTHFIKPMQTKRLQTMREKAWQEYREAVERKAAASPAPPERE